MHPSPRTSLGQWLPFRSDRVISIVRRCSKLGIELKLSCNQFLVFPAIIAVIAAGCSRPTVQVPLQYGIIEVEEAVEEIEIGKTTRNEVNALIGPFVESRGLFRLKETGGDRNYFFLMGDRQIWMEFTTGPEGEATVSKLGKLEPKAEYIKGWEGGYLTFSPDEYPWE